MAASEMGEPGEGNEVELVAEKRGRLAAEEEPKIAIAERTQQGGATLLHSQP